MNFKNTVDCLKDVYSTSTSLLYKSGTVYLLVFFINIYKSAVNIGVWKESFRTAVVFEVCVRWK